MSDHQTEAAAVAEIARESERFGREIYIGNGKIHANVLRADEKLLVASHERYEEAPTRARGEAHVGDAASFTTLLAIDEHTGSLIFADEKRAQLTAVVNFHGWRDHRITLQLSQSEQFMRWTRASGQFYSQVDFAELIEDGLAEIVNPDSADMLELAQTFQATKSLQFESGTRIASGAVRFRYLEEIDAKAGRAGELDVPSMFVLRLPVWRGGALVEFPASLRYRISREGLKLGFKIAGLDDILRVAFEAAVASVREQLDDADEHTLVYGPAPEVIQALP